MLFVLVPIYKDMTEFDEIGTNQSTSSNTGIESESNSIGINLDQFYLKNYLFSIKVGTKYRDATIYSPTFAILAADRNPVQDPGKLEFPGYCRPSSGF